MSLIAGSACGTRSTLDVINPLGSGSGSQEIDIGPRPACRASASTLAYWGSAPNCTGELGRRTPGCRRPRGPCRCRSRSRQTGRRCPYTRAIRCAWWQIKSKPVLSPGSSRRNCGRPRCDHFLRQHV